MLLMLAWACPLMLAWVCRLHMSQHDCLSLSGKEFICWIKTALRGHVGSKLLPPVFVLCMFCLLRCGLAPAIKTAPRDMLDQNRSS